MTLLFLIHLLPSIFSAIAALAALFAGKKAHQALQLAQGVYPSYHKVTPANQRKLRFGRLFGAGPNDGADASTVANKFDGVNPATGAALQYRLYAWGYEAHGFGLGVDYAYPETSNVSASLGDAGTSLAKLFGRKRTLPDGNQYDAWDMLVASARAAVRTYPDIMGKSVEPLSKSTTPTPVTPTPATMPKVEEP